MSDGPNSNLHPLAKHPNNGIEETEETKQAQQEPRSENLESLDPRSSRK